MNTLKKLFPLSFKVKSGVLSLLINILIQVIVAAIAGVLIGVIAGLGLPVISWLFSIVCGLVDLYCLVGIILGLLYFFDIIK